MEELNKKSLNIIFTGKYKDVIDFCSSLNDKDRKTLYKDLKPYLAKVKEICKFNFNHYELIEKQTPYGLMKRYETKKIDIKDVLKIFLEEKDLDNVINEQKINIQSNPQSSRIFVKSKIFMIMLCEMKSILQNIKVNRNDNIINYSDNKKESFIYVFTQAMLERKENSKYDILCEYFENIEKYNQSFFYPCFYDSVKLVLDNYKDKENDLKKYLAKALYYDGIRNDYEKIHTYDPELIVMSLDFSPTDERTINAFPHPVSLSYMVDKLKVLITNNYLPRQELIDITLKNLLTQNRNSIITGWVRIYETINPNKNEVLERKETYINLLNSISSQGIQIALNEIKNILNDISDEYELLIDLLSFNLNNTVQKVSKASFLILKSLLKNKTLNNSILDSIIKNLYIPNKNLRIEVLKWIKTQNLNNNQKESIKNLFKDSNELIELDIIKDFFDTEEKMIQNNDLNNTYNEIILNSDIKLINNKYLKNFENINNLIINGRFDLNYNKIKVNTLNYDLDKKIEVFNNEVEFAEYLSLFASSSKKVLPLSLEIIFASVLKFKNVVEKEKVEKILDPCFKAINTVINFKEDINEFRFINLPINNIIACLAGYIWLNRQNVKIKNNISFQYGDYLAYKRLNSLLSYINSDNIYSLLSTPDYFNYFIEPETFANKLINRSIESIDFNDLFVSLFRLNLLSKEKTLKAWEIIEKYLSDKNKFSFTKTLKAFIGNQEEIFNNFKIQSLILAFAPLEIAKKSLNIFLRFFDNNSTTDFILCNEFLSELYNNDDNINNQVFRLFNASLRARYNIESPFTEMPELENININGLKIDLGSDRMKYQQDFQELMEQNPRSLNFNLPINIQNYRVTKEFKDLSDKEKKYFKELIFFPYRLEKDSLIVNGIQNTNYIYIKPDLLYYPHLEHYYSSFEYSGFNYLEANTEQKVSSFPHISQRLFELSINKSDLIKTNSKYYTKFLSLANINTVDISGGIDILFYPLIQKNIKDKDYILETIYECLKQGKINPDEIINNFSNLFSETKGFKYIIESIKYLNSMSNVFEMLTILSIEKYFASENVNNKNISVLSEIMIELMQKYNRQIKNSKSLEFLQDSINSKKSNSFKDKAKIILDLQKEEDNFEKLLLVCLVNELNDKE